MPPVGFESTITACEWPLTYALDRVATGTGINVSDTDDPGAIVDTLTFFISPPSVKRNTLLYNNTFNTNKLCSSF
jgi:hypothetical protein